MTPAEWHDLCDRFHARSVCTLGNKPELFHDPGCDYIRCQLGAGCHCKMQDGGDMSPTSLTLTWFQRYQKPGA